MAVSLRTAANLYDVYADLRSRTPVAWSASDAAFLVSRYADVAACLRDPALSSVVTPRSQDGRSLAAAGPCLDILHRQLDLMDALAHTAIRRIFATVFDAAHVSRLRAFTGDWLEERLGALPRRFDLVAEIARPLARAMVVKLLGIGPARVDAFEQSVSTFIGGMHDPEPNAARAQEAIAVLRRLVESALRDSNLDARTVIGAARETNVLSIDDVVANTVLIFAAGLQTTAHLIGTGAWMVLTNAAAQADLRANPRLWPSAVEEIARLESPVQFVRRVATQSLEIAGCQIAEGGEVVLLLGAANRDPGTFPGADRFDVARAPNRHLAFGGGPHACIGAQVARMQTRAALESVCAVSGLAVSDRAPNWVSSIAYRGLASLHVDWS